MRAALIWAQVLGVLWALAQVLGVLLLGVVLAVLIVHGGITHFHADSQWPCKACYNPIRRA